MEHEDIEIARPTKNQGEMDQGVEVAYLAGGCFWGMQELFRSLLGVLRSRVGYMGGRLPNASYLQLKHQPSGHAETVELHFDPARLSYWEVLRFFFQIHDPTTPNRQGNDVGESYRSVLFTTSDSQTEAAQEAIRLVNASGLWPGPVVTEVIRVHERGEPAQFWEAEPEHQDYLQRYPNGYTCHWLRREWRLPDRNGLA